MADVRRVVIKVGTSTLTDDSGRIDPGAVKRLAAATASLQGNGIDVILVSSAAIAAGVEGLGLSERPTDIPGLQACAAVGQVELMRAYRSAFCEHDTVVGQVLLTRNDTADRVAYLHARDTIDRLLSIGAVPIINENDTVAVDEIRFGDNDTLAALIAVLTGSDLVVIFTDTEGLKTCDPRLDPDARVIPLIEEITPEHIRIAGGAGSVHGTGGMFTKVKAGEALIAAGISLVVTSSACIEQLEDIVHGADIGTRFRAREGARRMNSRKMWIALARTVRGSVAIDDGAVHALRTNGRSLLAVGVHRVEGLFSPGDCVAVTDLDGNLIARGLVSFSSDELARILRLHNDEISEILPGKEGIPVIHRDELAVL